MWRTRAVVWCLGRVPEALALRVLRRLNRQGRACDVALAWSFGHRGRSPVTVRTSASLAFLVNLYGYAGRRGLLLSGVRRQLLEASRTGEVAPDDLFEWFCILFSEKQWRRIARSAGRAGDVPGPERRAGVADLLYSVWHRLHLSARPRLALRARRGLEGLRGLPVEQRALHTILDRHVAGDLEWARRRLGAEWTYGPAFALAPVSAVLAAGDSGARASLPRLADLECRYAPRSEVVSVSCDRVYAERFLAGYLAALRRVAPDVGLHVHCAGFDPRASGLEAFARPEVGWSHVPMPETLVAASEERRRAWYACLRLILLEDLLAHYAVVHVSDLDGVPVRPPDEAWSDAPHPVHLRTRLDRPEPRRLPWQSVSAAHLTVRAGVPGRRFAAAVRSYLARCFGRPLGQTWYADQVALYHAYIALRGEIAIGTGPGGFFEQGGDWSFAGGDAGKEAFMARRLAQQGPADGA